MKTSALRVRPSDPNRPGEPSAGSDVDRMRRLCDGDLSALGEIYNQYYADIRRFALRMAGPSDVDDIVHDVFLTLVQVAPTYDGRPCVKPFLFGIAAKLVLRRRQGLNRLARAMSAFGRTVSGSLRRTPEDVAGDAEQHVLFDRAFADLSDEKRVVFLMLEVEGLSGSEAAEALAIPVATVWTRLHYARRELRDAIEKGAGR